MTVSKSSPPAAAAASPASPKSSVQPNSPPTASSPAGILPASHWEAIEQEQERDNDANSTYSDAISSTTSLSSSILHYRTIQGRTYHSDIGKAEAWGPNDKQHSQSLDTNHFLVETLIGNKMFLAPIKNDVKKVLDVGTGTGIWAIDFGDQYPGTEVTGTDVSPIQPGWVPPNVKFEIDDANLEWTWDENSFDFIHVRGMIGCIADWQSFYKEAFRCCTPGGWIEANEPAFPFCSDQAGGIREDSAMGQWTKVFFEGGKKFGRTFRVVEDDIQRKYMEEAGFVDIVVKDFKCPIGDWPKDPEQKDLGILSRLVLTQDIEGYVLYMWNAVMGWSPTEVKVYVAHLRREVFDKNVESYFTRRVVYGRKPETA